jgi:hypothetical protein
MGEIEELEKEKLRLEIEQLKKKKKKSFATKFHYGWLMGQGKFTEAALVYAIGD